jgi:2',3'-cyclic-nucleotide 2'-phosphodiesterase (5'-nucleotidase family)
MRHTHVFAIPTALALGLASLAFAATPAAAVDPPVTVDLLSVNDFHGRIEADPASNVAGAAVLSGVVKAQRAANPNTLFVSAGDLIGASTFTSFIAKDQPTIDAFNAMGLDARGAPTSTTASTRQRTGPTSRRTCTTARPGSRRSTSTS